MATLDQAIDLPLSLLHACRLRVHDDAFALHYWRPTARTGICARRAISDAGVLCGPLMRALHMLRTLLALWG